MITFYFILFAFLLGAVPFGLFVAQAFCGIDPRLVGSKNTGATNVARNCGFGYGVLTLACDLLKGLIPLWLASAACANSFFLSLIGLAAILGHMFSPFMYGKGGKGVATALGVFLYLAPMATICAALACLVVILLSGYVSMGSLTMLTVLPLIIFFQAKWGVLPAALVAMLLVFYKHRENIDRLIKGQENPWRKK